MYYSKGTLLVFFVACSLALAADDETNKVDATEDRVSAVAPAHQSSSELLGIPQNLLQAFTQGGAVLAGMFALAALMMLIVPNLANTRFCPIFGNCAQDIVQAHSAQGNGFYSDYSGYGQAGTFNSPNYQKRSIEYIAPVLKAIGTAYDKYNQAGGATAKKLA